MRAVLLLAPLALGCKIDLDHKEFDANTTGRTCKVSTATVCKEAESHSDFTWIKGKIFAANCFGSSCHSGTVASGKLDLTDDPYLALMGSDGMGRMANNDAAHKLIVPSDPSMSYLFFMIHGLDDNPGPFSDPPANVGFMPMSNSTLCCQKIDAINRWIMAGAMNN
jgi:hypothetical protein